MVAIIMFRPHSSCFPAVAVPQLLLLLFPRVWMRQQPMLFQLPRTRRLKTAEAAGEAHTHVGAQLVPTQHASRDRPMVARVAGEDLLPGVYILEKTNQCCGSGSGIRCLFDPGIRNRFFSGSRIPNPYF
jgi:hypothetical protein